MTVYQEASFFFLFCIYDNVICKAEVSNKSSCDADTTFMVIQCLTYDSLYYRGLVRVDTLVGLLL